MSFLTKLVLITTAAFIGYAAFTIHSLTQPPLLPKLDENAFWGPGKPPAKQDTSVKPFKIKVTDENHLMNKPGTSTLSDMQEPVKSMQEVNQKDVDRQQSSTKTSTLGDMLAHQTANPKPTTSTSADMMEPVESIHAGQQRPTPRTSTLGDMLPHNAHSEPRTSAQPPATHEMKYFTILREYQKEIKKFNTTSTSVTFKFKPLEGENQNPMIWLEALKDLKNRLETSRPFTPPLEGIQQQYGFNTNLLTKVVDYWKKDYKWRERETFLNQFPQYTTNIQGLEMHFLHVKPTAPTKRVLPLLLLHGWPGSVREFYKIIPLLTKPQQDRDFVFEVIAPSLPGFAFSQAAAKPGLGDVQAAVVFKNLMKRIGHDKFYVQGGDWGAITGSHMATLFPKNVLGLHSNMCTSNGLISQLKLMLGSIYPPLIVDKKYEHLMYPVSTKIAVLMEETGYLHIQATKPDTVGVGLNQSPIGLAAYILEKFSTATNYTYKAREDGGLLEKFTYDELLDNVMLYWITNSFTSAARYYAESFNRKQIALGVNIIPISPDVPCACARFDQEVTYATDWILKDKYTNLVHTSDFDRGGHFAAFEEPRLLAEDVFSAVTKMERLRR